LQKLTPICRVFMQSMFKLGQLDFSPENLDHLPTNRRNFINFARDAIVKSSAPTLTTDVSMKYITTAGLDFITSDVGLQRSIVRAELTSLYTRPEIRSIAEEIIQTQMQEDADLGLPVSPITAQQITAKANEIQNLNGRISFNPETRSYEFQSTERAFLTSRADTLETYRRTVDMPQARDYVRENIQRSIDPTYNVTQNFRSRNIRDK